MSGKAEQSKQKQTHFQWGGGAGGAADKIDGVRRPTPQHQRKEEKQSRMDAWYDIYQWSVEDNKALFKAVAEAFKANDGVGIDQMLQEMYDDPTTAVEDYGIAPLIAGSSQAQYDAVKRAIINEMDFDSDAWVRLFDELRAWLKQESVNEMLSAAEEGKSPAAVAAQ